MKTRNILYILAGFIIAFAIMRQCESEPKVVTKTETVIKWKVDSVFVEKIVKGDKVYVEKIKTVKGKDSIVYKDKPSETTITANTFKTKLTSNKAIADLSIVTTGEVLDVQGTITYPEKETITTITKTKNKSGFYLYGSVPIDNFSSPEIGVMYQIKNTFGVMGGVQYNSISNTPEIKAGVLIKLF